MYEPQYFLSCPPAGRGTNAFFGTGMCCWTSYRFENSDSGTGYHFRKICSMIGSIFAIFNSERPFQAICTFRMWFKSLGWQYFLIFWYIITNFLCTAQSLSKKLKDRMLFKKILLRDRVSFSGNWLSVSDFPAAPPRMFVDQVPPWAYELRKNQS